MKIRIELDENLDEPEVVIRTSGITPEITQLQNMILEASKEQRRLEFYKGETRVYLVLDEVLFFETTDRGISAHTVDESYEIRYKLYELEEMLPRKFMRVSKSAILNTEKIFAIDRNITSSSEVSFRETRKQVFVSRHYYKALMERLNERRKGL